MGRNPYFARLVYNGLTREIGLKNWSTTLEIYKGTEESRREAPMVIEDK